MWMKEINWILLDCIYNNFLVNSFLVQSSFFLLMLLNFFGILFFLNHFTFQHAPTLAFNTDRFSRIWNREEKHRWLIFFRRSFSSRIAHIFTKEKRKKKKHFSERSNHSIKLLRSTKEKQLTFRIFHDDRITWLYYYYWSSHWSISSTTRLRKDEESNTPISSNG